MTAIRPGATVWRIIGSRALRRQYTRPLPGGLAQVRASAFGRATEQTVRAEDVFTDRDECRAEIARRKETANG
jgi:hypothetical protein